MHMISLKNRGFCSGNWIDDVWWLFQGFSSFIYGVICFPLQWLTTGCKNITQFMRIPVFSLALLCVCAKKKKISDVTVMQFCQVPVFNFYSVGHRCFLSISSPLSNVGSRRWILNLSGWDPGTHTHKKRSCSPSCQETKKQETNTPVCVSVVAAHTRPLKDLAVVHLCVPLSY